ncbi:hypothetical protein B0T18DRAFT_433110 [Schizothecium vesticola]|uniref:Uncharacterized protein n=1 Tax=Schizothecium vesticola TaxID=314040 RepID=A0AA40BQ07_9PEZI|nr:hypothetical protein B0T18DRAFT_433110 [Schizothecium vesticola]
MRLSYLIAAALAVIFASGKPDKNAHKAKDKGKCGSESIPVPKEYPGQEDQGDYQTANYETDYYPNEELGGDDWYYGYDEVRGIY